MCMYAYKYQFINTIKVYNILNNKRDMCPKNNNHNNDNISHILNNYSNPT